MSWMTLGARRPSTRRREWLGRLRYNVVCALTVMVASVLIFLSCFLFCFCTLAGVVFVGVVDDVMVTIDLVFCAVVFIVTRFINLAGQTFVLAAPWPPYSWEWPSCAQPI